MPFNRTPKRIALVPLSQGKVAIIDADDAEKVLAFKWTAMESYPGLWYAYRKDDRKSILLHRFIMGAPDEVGVDHWNGDGLDNRRENLRLATESQNGANRGLQSNNSSGFKGVVFHRRCGRWQARIKVQGKTISLRYHDTPEKAAHAYDKAARKFFGEFAYLNFPDDEDVAA